MSFTKSILAAGLLSLGVFAGTAVAADMNIIQERQACMKAQGKALGGFAGIMKGDTPYDAAAVQAAFAPMETACANWAKFWGEDSKPGSELAKATENWTKDEMWTDAEGKKKAEEAGYTAMQALKATTDEAGFKAAFPAVGEGCKGCHEKFRRPKEG